MALPPLQGLVRRALPLLLAAGLTSAHGTFPLPPVVPPPAPAVPAAPAPSPPVPAAPGQPGASGTPGTGAPNVPGAQPNQPGTPTTPSSMDSVDLTHWSYWWQFNRDELLRLRERLMANQAFSGQSLGSNRAPYLPSPGVVEQVVVPSLITAVEEAKYDGVVSAALVALGRSSSNQRERIAEVLDGALESRDPQVREAALLSRALLAELDGISLLVRVLEEDRDLRKQLGRKPDQRMRSFAAFALAVLAEESPIQEVRRMALLHLAERLRDTKEDRDLRVALAVSIGSMTIPWNDRGDGVSPERDHGDDLRYREDLVRLLLELQEDEGVDLVRAHLVVALGELFQDGGGPEELRAQVADVLIEALDERQSPHVRNSLLMALGHMGTAWGAESDKRIRAYLLAASVDGKGGQRDDFARHLALMGLAEASTRSPGPAPAPATTRAAFEQAIVERMRRASDRESTWLCLAAASYAARSQAQGQELGPDLLRTLEEALSKGSSSDRLATASLALGLSGNTASAPVIKKVMDRTGNASIRGFTALSLGLLGHEESTDELEILLHDNRYQAAALEHTAMGLALLNRARANEALRELLSNAHSQTLAGGIAVAIGRISDPAAAAQMASYVSSGDTPAVLRSFCTVSLGLLADGRELPWRRHLARGVNYAAWTDTLFHLDGMGVLNIL